jgi:uncharacterized protein YeaO (DUF488 family)
MGNNVILVDGRIFLNNVKRLDAARSAIAPIPAQMNEITSDIETFKEYRSKYLDALKMLNEYEKLSQSDTKDLYCVYEAKKEQDQQFADSYKYVKTSD